MTVDGTETDLGHYEWFINYNLAKELNIISGRIYQNVIKKNTEVIIYGGWTSDSSHH